MKIAFRYANASFFGRMISFWTRSKFQHVEILFENPIPIAFSSSEDDGGTRFKNITDLVDANAWKVIPVPVSKETELAAYDYVKKSLLGLKYNWADIVSMVFHNIDPDVIPGFKNSYICSAVCLRILQECGFYTKVRCDDCSPELLFELVSSINA